MTNAPAKATSVTATGEPDGFAIQPGWEPQADPGGQNRLLVSVPTHRLAQVHAALFACLGAPLGVLYRQAVNRLLPAPQGAPPTDFVGLNLAKERVSQAISQASDLVFHDARCELWLRGALGDQLILDQDGLLYVYPDDPAFRRALDDQRLPQAHVETMLDRDYVKHWFHQDNDALEAQFIDALSLTRLG